MKNNHFTFVLCTLLLSQSLFAQFPVSFPDGVIVGFSTVTIPTGSTLVTSPYIEQQPLNE